MAQSSTSDEPWTWNNNLRERQHPSTEWFTFTQNNQFGYCVLGPHLFHFFASICLSIHIVTWSKTWSSVLKSHSVHFMLIVVNLQHNKAIYTFLLCYFIHHDASFRSVCSIPHCLFVARINNCRHSLYWCVRCFILPPLWW